MTIERSYHHYVIVHHTSGQNVFGPFKTEQERDDFASALWFGQPARMPYAERGENIPFNNTKDRLYYTAVDLGTARLMSIRDALVRDLQNGKSFPCKKKRRTKGN